MYKKLLASAVVTTLLVMLSGCNDSKENKKPEIVLDEMPMPYNGRINSYTNSQRIAPFTIKTSHGDNYFVKLKDVYSNSTVIDIFIRGGQTVETKVPLGTYKIVYASGDKWYGEKHLFGKNTSYSKTDQNLNFTQTYNGVSGYTISLYRVANGNLRTSGLNPSEF